MSTATSASTGSSAVSASSGAAPGASTVSAPTDGPSLDFSAFMVAVDDASSALFVTMETEATVEAYNRVYSAHQAHRAAAGAGH